MGQSAQDPLPCAAEVPATFSQLGRPSLGEGLCGLLWEPSVQEVSVPARAVVVFLGHLSSLLGAYSDGRGGARISALVGGWLIVFAVQDVWGGVSAIPSYLWSQNLCLCVDTVVSVWL